ncbi:hypothetical protein [Clostridium sp. BJN0001]|uniref:hypothetical protein n=1 Tax=Clostridium sp. BJN0001 TaxID=2930219 RepID=UPI001FD463BB|nr:hypothetical protein [Clostridium sp. BJN0001]
MKRKISFLIAVVLSFSLTCSGCSISDNIGVKLGLINNQFDYMKQNKVDEIVIQNVRDTGFRFIVTDTKAIDDIYRLLKDGKQVDKKSEYDPDYIFEVHIGDEIRKYNYVVGVKKEGNFYDDDTVFNVSNNLDDIILQNLSFIRKPRNFETVYYETILNVLDKKKDQISDLKIGVNLSADADCLKYVFSKNLEEFKKQLSKQGYNVSIIDDNSSDFDIVLSTRNRGYNSKIFKTAITINNKKDSSSSIYYVSAEYDYQKWNIKVSDPDKMPEDW